MKPAALLLLAAGLLPASDPPGGERVKEEIKKLEGTWVMVSVTSNGKPVEEALGGEWLFAGDTVTTKSKSGEARKNQYKIDPSRKPKAIDTTPVLKDERTALGIYELDGDTLKVCFGVERPVKFTAKGQMLFTLKRKQP